MTIKFVGCGFAILTLVRTSSCSRPPCMQVENNKSPLLEPFNRKSKRSIRKRITFLTIRINKKCKAILTRSKWEQHM